MNQSSTAPRSRRDHVADILTTAILRALAGRGACRPAKPERSDTATTDAVASEQAQPAEAA
jgi:hypothetical protein